MTWLGVLVMWVGVIAVVGLFVQSVVYERRNRKRD
jgi:hypothetical protein